MEQEVSLPRLLEHANYLFSKSCLELRLLKFHLILSNHLRQSILNGLLPSGLPTKTIRLSPYKPHARHI